MKLKQTIYPVLVAFLGLLFFILIPQKVHAGMSGITYQISYSGYRQQEAISTTGPTVSSGSVTLPNDVEGIFCWLYEDARAAYPGDTVIVDKDTEFKAVYMNDLDQNGSAGGTYQTDGIWFISHGELFISGVEEISYTDIYSQATISYSNTVDSYQMEGPEISYDRLIKGAVGDEDRETPYGEMSGEITEEEVGEASGNVYASTTKHIYYDPAFQLSDFPWAAYASTVERIWVADTVTLRGNMTFLFNLNSSSTEGPDSIRESLFTNLQTVYLLADTGNVTSMAGMFARCPSLNNIYVKEGKTFDTGNVKDMQFMFYGNPLLVLEDTQEGYASAIHVMDTSSCQTMRFMFYMCESLSRPSIGDWDVSSVKDMSFMFSGCRNLRLCCDSNQPGRTYNLANWDVSSVEMMMGMFSNPEINPDDPLHPDYNNGTQDGPVEGTFDLGAWDGKLDQVVAASMMFADNGRLTRLGLGASIARLKDASGFAAWCGQLEQVDGEDLSTPSLLHASGMFNGSGREGAQADFSGWNMGKLTHGELMFYKSGFSNINMDRTNPAALTHAKGMFSSCRFLTCLGTEGLAGWQLSKVTDSSYMFYNDKLLTGLDLAGWNMELCKDASYMFYGCLSLEELDLDGIGKDKLENIDGFLCGAGLASIDISQWQPFKVRSAFAAFSHMPHLRNVEMRNVDFTMLENASGLFWENPLLETVEATGSTWTKLTDCSGMFYGDSSLREATIPAMGDEAVDLRYMCYGCEALTSFDMGSWVLTGAEWMQGMFDHASSLEEILLPGTSIPQSRVVSTAAMFRECSSLSAEEIEKMIHYMGSTTLLEDTSCMMENCTSVTTLDLSSMDFGRVTKLDKMMKGMDQMVSLKLPDSFGSQATGAREVFHTAALTPTTLQVMGTHTLPSFFAAYPFQRDNRTFLIDNGTRINETETNNWIVPYGYTQDITLSVLSQSTFLLEDQQLLPSYVWKEGDALLTDANIMNLSILTLGSDKAGNYSCTICLPGMDAGISYQKEFTLGQESYMTQIHVEYTGEHIPVGKQYQKSDVKVTATVVTGSESEEITLTEEEFILDRLEVTKGGDNVFQVKVVAQGGRQLTADFVVTGIRVVDRIKAVYDGPAVLVGEEHDTRLVKVTAFYADDTQEKEGFLVNPTAFESALVVKEGENSYKVSYYDPVAAKTFEAVYTVPGYTGQEKRISFIEAIYTGKEILVGSEYDTADVEVMAFYEDDKQKKNGFHVSPVSFSSKKIEKEGENSFEVSYHDPLQNKTLKATFTVIGYVRQQDGDKKRQIDRIEAVYTGPGILVGNKYDVSNVKVTAYYTDDEGKKEGLSVTPTSFSSRIVKEVGTNTYTVTYFDPANNQTLTASFQVTGYIKQHLSDTEERKVGWIEAAYIGPDVLVGMEYDSEKVQVTAYYEDDTEKKEGLLVKEVSFNSKKVTSRGINTYKVTYVDTAGKAHETSFYVTGYGAASFITAVYNGNDVLVGQNYDKGNVVVTAHYKEPDGSQNVTDFNLDSQLVSSAGSNSYIAIWKDALGIEHRAAFTVNGMDLEVQGTTPSESGGGNSSSSEVTDQGQQMLYHQSMVRTVAENVQTGDKKSVAFWFIMSIFLGGIFGCALLMYCKQGEYNYMFQLKGKGGKATLVRRKGIWS